MSALTEELRNVLGEEREKIDGLTRRCAELNHCASVANAALTSVAAERDRAVIALETETTKLAFAQGTIREQALAIAQWQEIAAKAASAPPVGRIKRALLLVRDALAAAKGVMERGNR